MRVTIAVFAFAWFAGSIATWHRVWVQRGEPWYGKLFAYAIIFLAWPFLLLYMRDRG